MKTNKVIKFLTGLVLTDEPNLRAAQIDDWKWIGIGFVALIITFIIGIII